MNVQIFSRSKILSLNVWVQLKFGPDRFSRFDDHKRQPDNPNLYIKNVLAWEFYQFMIETDEVAVITKKTQFRWNEKLKCPGDFWMNE